MSYCFMHLSSTTKLFPARLLLRDGSRLHNFFCYHWNLHELFRNGHFPQFQFLIYPNSTNVTDLEGLSFAKKFVPVKRTDLAYRFIIFVSFAIVDALCVDIACLSFCLFVQGLTVKRKIRTQQRFRDFRVILT